MSSTDCLHKIIASLKRRLATELHAKDQLIAEVDTLIDIIKDMQVNPDPTSRLIQSIESNGSLESLDLSQRAYNLLRRGGVKNTESLLGATDDWLLSQRGMGKKTFYEIKLIRDRCVYLHKELCK